MAWIEDPIENKSPAQYVTKLAQALGNVTILQKGQVDLISKGKAAAFGNAKGSNRRCGGQGDVLAGTCGLFMHWAYNLANEDPNGGANQHQHASGIMVGFAASLLTRTANRLAFEAYGRSATTPDILEKVGLAFAQTLETDEAACHASSLL